MKIVVTGGAGYIGGQTVLQLLAAGHEVLAIDRSLESNPLTVHGGSWLVADVVSEVSLDTIRRFEPDALIHCAGTSLVGPSMLDPREYYLNNFIKTKTLCDFLLTLPRRPRIIFSSSAATYGNPVMTPCQEVDPTEPISPYGQSKLMVDWLLRSYNHAYGLDYVSFRYFNACGADSQARHGQRPGATHIIARVLESIRDGAHFTLNGTDYPTADGTCVRDYIHVEDLAAAHILACDPNTPAGLYNLGTNRGHSNREIVAMAEQVTGQRVDLGIGGIRPGDPATLTADASKFMSVTSWRPQWDLEHMVQHAWAWYKK